MTKYKIKIIVSQKTLFSDVGYKEFYVDSDYTAEKIAKIITKKALDGEEI